MTDQKVVDTFEATMKVVETLSKSIDVLELELRQVRADVLALANRIESLTAYTRELHNYKSKL